MQEGAINVLVEIIGVLKQQYPPSYGSHQVHFVNWDVIDQFNVKTAVTAVELNKEVLGKAIAEKADLMIIHHDLFSPDSNQTIHGVRRQLLRAIMRHGLVIYALEDSIVGAVNGLSEALAAEVGLTKQIRSTFQIENEPLGRIAQLPGTSIRELIETVHTALNPQWIQQSKGGKQILKKVLIIPGTLKINTLKKAIREGVDGVLTGEFSYKVARLAFEENMTIIGVGHISSETPGMRNLAINLAMKFKDINIEFIPSPGLIIRE